MNIDERAQQILLKLMETDKTGYDAEGISIYAYEIADAMQAESDKRKPKGLPEVLFEPDWSQAPKWARWWYSTSDKKFQWCSNKPYQDGCNWFVNCGAIYTLDVAPSFNYQGDWKNSLRKRP